MRKTQHRNGPVERSAFARELKDFGAWLGTEDYSTFVVRRHVIRLHKVLCEMASTRSFIYTPERLCAAFDKHNAYRQHS